MLNWNDNQIGDGKTKAGFNELSPSFINFALTLAGQTAPDLGEAFTYAEIGCGFGLSVSAWAAQYPAGDFYALEPGPVPAAWLTKLAGASGLGNLHVLERSFAQMASDDLPQFDYIVLHGSLSLIPGADRERIRDFIGKFLKPGGAVYLGYNAQPGWTAAEPLRRIIVEGARATGEKNPLLALTQGLNFLKELKDAGAVYFKNMESAAGWLDGWFNWIQRDSGSMVSELLHAEHKAFYFSEMVDFLAEAKVSYVGSLDLANYLEPLITPPDFLKRLEQVNGSLALRETVKDFLYNNAFRRDIFVKGPQPLTKAKATKALGKLAVTLCSQPANLEGEVILKNVRVSLKKEVYQPVIDFLAKGTATLAAVVKETGLDFTAAAQAVTVLLALGWAQLSPVGTKAETVRHYNVALDELLGAESFRQMLTANAGWLAGGPMERLYALATIKGEDPAKFIGETIAERGWTLSRDDKPLTGDELAGYLAEQVKRLDGQIKPNLKTLGLID